MNLIYGIILDVISITLIVLLCRWVKQQIHERRVIQEYQKEMDRLRQQKKEQHQTSEQKQQNQSDERPDPMVKNSSIHYYENGFDKGEAGEWAIEYALKKSLPDNIYVLRNLYIPYKDIVSEIDLILLHETGIYIFESKNYSGWIFGNKVSTYWTQTFKDGQKVKRYNPIRQNETHVNAVVKEMKLPKTQRPKSYIVFGKDCELKAVPKSSENIVICKQQELIPIIERRIEEAPQIYNREVLKYMNAHLHRFEKY